VNLDGTCPNLSDEELEKFISRFPIETQGERNSTDSPDEVLVTNGTTIATRNNKREALMNENTEIRNPGPEHILNLQIDKMAPKYGASNSVKSEVRSRIKLIGHRREAEFRVLDDEGRLATIDSYVLKLKSVPAYANQFARKYGMGITQRHLPELTR
jgi:hypothetical protein